MPSPTIRLRVTERLSALIERVWNAAPELRDDFPATVLNALALYAEYREGRPAMFGAVKQPSKVDQPINEPPEAESSSSDDEWS